MKKRLRFPTAVDPERVGKYPAVTASGGGYVWDEVLEYRVWCHPERGAPDLADGSDYFYSFPTYPRALAYARRTTGAEAPLALIRQKQYIDEPEPGRYIHVKKARLTEWPVEFLSRPRRSRNTISDFLSPTAPVNRLAILRGISKVRRVVVPASASRRRKDPE